jgi:hypothetical protein
MSCAVERGAPSIGWRRRRAPATALISARPLSWRCLARLDRAPVFFGVAH